MFMRTANLNKSYLGLVISILLFVCSCRDKKYEPLEPDSCFLQSAVEYQSIPNPDFSCCDCPIGLQELNSAEIPFDYFYPTINTSTTDEIYYYKKDNINSSFGYEIWKTNLCTGDQVNIINGALHEIEWGQGDWIFYTGIDQKIYKVKGNGDSLRLLDQASLGVYNRGVKVNPSGTQILFQTVLGNETILKLADIDGNPTQDIINSPSVRTWDWVNDSIICYVYRDNRDQEFYLKRLDSGELTKFFEFPIVNTTDSLITDIQFSSSTNSIIWVGLRTIGLTRIETGETEIIYSGYSDEQFLSIDVVDDWKSIILNKRKMHQIDFCTMDSDYEFIVLSLEQDFGDKKLLFN
jgi:hypothetical protein